MHEDLVGYLFGALDQDGADRIENQLANDHAMRRELDRIGTALRPLKADSVDVDPPPDLASRTVRLVLENRKPEPCIVARQGQWRLTDLAIAAGILIAISTVMLPAINESRQQRALVDCRNNLRTIGVALESYNGKHGGYLPFYATQGPLAIAGIYAPILIESQFVSDRSVFVCQGAGDAVAGIYSLGELRAAQADIEYLSSMSRTVGGSYGSLLGFKERGAYQSPRRDRLGGQTILVDRPRRANEGDIHQNSPNHGGHGQNMLWRDGSVRFLCYPKECPGCDDMFVNWGGCVGPGWNESDQVFGSSDARLCCEGEQF
jgi:anti-sigma-K factor RskA